MKGAAAGAPAHTPSGVRAGVADGALGRGQSTPHHEDAKAQPPASHTGAELTAHIHWLRGTTAIPVDDVLQRLAHMLGESVVVLDHGNHGYSAGYLIGGAKVYAHAERPDMGVCVNLDGMTCEQLGLRRIAAIYWDLELRASRIDPAVDYCAFSPAQLFLEWKADRVRTRAKVPKNAREDRAWRSCSWKVDPEGDVFSMGARSSSQYARCYNTRGFTRFELELKGTTAEAAARSLFSTIEDQQHFTSELLSWIRRFVDFVDADSDANISRATLLPFWSAFVGSVQKARVSLEGSEPKTMEDIHEWFSQQVAPALAMMEVAYGWSDLRKMAVDGRRRWRKRHHAVLRAAGLSP